jgi:3-hydroxyisobutyrate dehydrogenase
MSDPLYRIPGGISMGSVAKMCHQHQAATNIIMAAEVMGLAAMAGLNTKDVYEAINQSDGWSWMFENRGPHMLSSDWGTVHSAVSIILKDVRIVTQHADTVGFPLILANTAQQLYIAGTHAGYTKEDDAGLVRLYLSAENRDAVSELAKGPAVESGKAGITIQTIINIMAGVHLASTRECLAFAGVVGMDMKLLIDIVKRGAGASKMFEIVARTSFENEKVSLTTRDVVEEVRCRLQAGLEQAKAIKQSMPMAAAALEQLIF